MSISSNSSTDTPRRSTRADARRWLAVSLVLMVMTFAAAAEPGTPHPHDPPEADQARYQDALRAGLDALEAGDAQTATAHAHEAEQRSPGRWETAALDALILLGSDQPTSARAALRRAHDAGDPPTRQAIAEVLGARDRHRTATLLTEEAAAAVVAGSGLRAADRLALANALLHDVTPPATPDADSTPGQALLGLLWRHSLAEPAAANAVLLRTLDDLATIDPLAGEQLQDPVVTPKTTPQRVAARLWADALALHAAEQPDLAWRAIDLLLQLDPQHEAAHARIEAHWSPRSPLGVSLTRLVSVPLDEQGDADPDADANPTPTFIDAAGHAHPIRFERKRAEDMHASVAVPLGRFSNRAAAEQALAGFQSLCEQAMPPGWRWHRAQGPSPRAYALRGDRVLELHMVSVTYDQADPPVEASVVLEVRKQDPDSPRIAVHPAIGE